MPLVILTDTELESIVGGSDGGSALLHLVATDCRGAFARDAIRKLQGIGELL
jgi:hypothetical protein